MRSLLLTCLIYFCHLQASQGVDESDFNDNSFSFARFRASLLASSPLLPLPPTPPLSPRTPSPVDTFDPFVGPPASPPSSRNRSSLIWQPLPLRATFRPLNRGSNSRGSNEPVGLISERSISVDPSANSDLTGPFSARTFFPTRETTTTTTTAEPLLNFQPEDELPTRQPMNRFRPPTRTEAPQSARSAIETTNVNNESSNLDEDEFPPANSSPFNNVPNRVSTNNESLSGYQISNECFECICEASTSCNAQSKCQTSDVRHTRCGMYLISYDQWLSTNLSRELVTREALARDAAADERAFYDCVTNRQCAERLLRIFMQRHQKDCDKDGRIDCYDLAAVHHSGMDQCASESLLDSQYWSDFNACFGFGR